MLFASRPIQLSAINSPFDCCLGDLVNREPPEHGAARYNGCDDEGDLWWFTLHRKGGILPSNFFPILKVVISEMSETIISVLGGCQQRVPSFSRRLEIQDSDQGQEIKKGRQGGEDRKRGQIRC